MPEEHHGDWPPTGLNTLHHHLGWQYFFQQKLSRNILSISKVRDPLLTGQPNPGFDNLHSKTKFP